MGSKFGAGLPRPNFELRTSDFELLRDVLPAWLAPTATEAAAVATTA
jgi:hypothetical protein